MSRTHTAVSADSALPLAIVYLAIAFYYMADWAGGKYRRYKKEFDPKVFPGKRYKMFPPFY